MSIYIFLCNCFFYELIENDRSEDALGSLTTPFIEEIEKREVNVPAMVKFLNMSLSCPKSKSFDLLSILRYRF
jgi:hypothetical protein